MDILKSPKFKITLLKICLIVPFALLIILPLFLGAYAGYLYLSGIRIEGIILPAIVIGVGLILIYSIRLMIFKIKKEAKIRRVWPIILVFLLIVSIAGIGVGIWEINFFYGANHYNTGPILTWGSDQNPSTDITIMWRTTDPSVSSISYSTDKKFSESSLTTLKENESVEWHQMAITGLNPDTKYYYRINDFEKTIYSFTTAPSLESAFNFLIFADPRQNSGDLGCLIAPNVPKYMAEKATSNDDFPEFTIVVGDITSEGTRHSTWKSWFDDISLQSGLASYAPHMDVVGNHERHDDMEGDIFADFYPLERQSNEQFYYSFNYSYIHFTMLDPWKVSNGEAGWEKVDDDQYNWAYQDLQKSMNRTFRIMCLHPPPLKRNADNNFNILLPRVTKLADTFNVSMVFFGHSHKYDHNLINGTHYLLNGVGGNIDAKTLGYSEIQATPENLTVMQHWLNGSTHKLATISN